jgi:hypothetical protein
MIALRNSRKLKSNFRIIVSYEYFAKSSKLSHASHQNPKDEQVVWAISRSQRD